MFYVDKRDNRIRMKWLILGMLLMVTHQKDSFEKKVERDNTSLTRHTLRGEVKKTVYQNEESGYTVLSVADHQGVIHTVVGNIVGAFEGQGVELQGYWENHKEHGRQFRVESYEFVLPATGEGIKRYLASGLIPGIGPVTAEAIVDKFGDRTLEIMDNYSARLLEVPGFGKKRLDMVRKAWKEQAAKRDVFIFLQGLGISHAYCNRIYRQYGDDAAELVRKNPFQLADEVDGIGFVKADKVAESLGIGNGDETRLIAGIGYSLRQLNQSGHVCFPREDFLKTTAELLGIREDQLVPALNKSVDMEKVIVETWNFPDKDPIDMVYSRELWSGERELTDLVLRLVRSRQFAAQKMTQVQSPQGAGFNARQLMAVQNVSRSALSVITGGPGVGKTTVVGEIVRQAKSAGLNVYLAAPTGRAAKRLGESCRKNAMTIHRMLKWDFETRSFVHGLRRPLTCDLLIVDEVSMLDINLAVFLFRAVKVGTSVVLVGDADQLPSVGPGNFLHDLIQSNCCAVTKLTQIYRQKENSHIISNAHLVNQGYMPELKRVGRNQLTDFYWIEQDDPEEVVSLILKMVKERIPGRFGFDPMRDVQVLTPMNRGSCGTTVLNQTLQHELNPANKPQFRIGERIYRQGDRVMQTSNNYDKNVFNGDMGRIVHIDSRDETFHVAFEGHQVEYEYDESDQLTLAYAITVHKSQGSEFPAVIVPLLTQHYVMLQRNLIYTAMTRARQLLVLIGSRKAVSLAVHNFRVKPRFSMFVHRLKAAN